MFKNYQNINPDYIPDNTTCTHTHCRSYTKLCPTTASKPYEEYDAKGNLIGYSWRYGETLNLDFNIDGEITVEDTAIILKAAGQLPPVDYGVIGQRAYNIVDLKSWTCTAIIDGRCEWAEDKPFKYDETADRSVYITADAYLKDKSIIVTLYNFRFEEVVRQSFKGSSHVVFPIDSDLSKKLVKGIYYCTMFVVTEGSAIPLFTTSDCTLLIK